MARDMSELSSDAADPVFPNWDALLEACERAETAINNERARQDDVDRKWMFSARWSWEETSIECNSYSPGWATDPAGIKHEARVMVEGSASFSPGAGPVKLLISEASDSCIEDGHMYIHGPRPKGPFVSTSVSADDLRRLFASDAAPNSVPPSAAARSDAASA